MDVAIGQRIAVAGAGMQVEPIAKTGAPGERALRCAVTISGVAKRSRAP